MTTILRRLFHRETPDEEWARWKRLHRWDELADYNRRVSQGIVHTPEYVARMEAEQAEFNAERGYGPGSTVFPVLLGPER